MKDLKQKLKMSSDDTVKDKLLYNPKFMKELKEKGLFIILMKILTVGDLMLGR